MSDAVAIDLPLEPESARRAREQLEPFRKALDEDTFFDLRLLVSELVVEVLLDDEERTRDHEIELRAELRDGRIHVEVGEGEDAFRIPAGHPEPGEAGWCLYLVGRLTSRWGIRREPRRSSVWLELPLAGSAP